jgi:hypothetical protein
LANYRGVTRRTISEWLQQLRKFGLITWHRRGSTSNDYEILGYERMVATLGEAHVAQTDTSASVSPQNHIADVNENSGSQQMRTPDHNRCDPGITRSRSSDPDPCNQGDGGGGSGSLFPVIRPPPYGQNLSAVFAKTLDFLIREQSPGYNTWLRDAELLELGDTSAVIRVRDEEVRGLCQDRLQRPVSRCLLAALGLPVATQMDVEFCTAETF